MKKSFYVICFILLLSIIPGKVIAENLTNNFPRKFGIKENMATLPIEPEDLTGSSWAQSFIDSIESTVLTNTKTEVELSVNNMLFQTSNFYNESFLKFPKEEGNHIIATSYLASWRGPVLEKDDPSSQKGEALKNSLITGTKSAYHVQEVLFLPERSAKLDIKSIKEYIMKFGSVSATMFFENFKENYNPKTSSWYCADNKIITPEKAEIVTLIGWNDDYSKSNFRKVPPNDGAFLVKAYNKFFYISYYDMLLGSSKKDEVGLSVITRVDENDNYDNIYQHDPLGYTSKYSEENNDRSAFFANIFTVQDNERYMENLSAVSFYTLEPDLDYEIYISTNYKNIYSLNKLKLIQKGSISLPGYHTIDLSKKIELNYAAKTAVAVKLLSKSKTPSIAFESPDGEIKNTADSSPDESYFKNSNGKWIDSIYYKTDSNICLKIFTDYSDTYFLQTLSPEDMKTDIDFLIDSLKTTHPDVKAFGFTESQERIISEVYTSIKSPLTESEFHLQLNRVLTMMNDLHVSLFPTEKETAPKARYLNLSFQWIEDGIFVDKNVGSFSKGDKIISIGGKFPDELRKLLYDQISAENDYCIRSKSPRYLTQKYFMDYFNLVNNDHSVDIVIERKGKLLVFKEFFTESYRVFNYDYLSDDFLWRIEESNDLAYFRFDSWIDSEHNKSYDDMVKGIESFFNEVSNKKINNIALDFRWNGGGYPALFYEFYKYLPYNLKDNYYSNQITKLSDNLLFKGNLYVLTSYKTYSQSVLAARTFKGNNVATIIGEPTGEKPNFNLKNRTIILPKTKWMPRITGYKPEKILGFSNDDLAIIPDILLNRTKSDIVTGRDSQLLRLREITRENKGYKYSNNILDLYFSNSGEKISLKLSENKTSDISLDKNSRALNIPFKISDIKSSSILSRNIELLNTCIIKDKTISLPSLDSGTYYLSIKLNNGENFLTLITFIEESLPVPMKIYSYLDTPEGPLDVSLKHEFDDYIFRTADCYSYVYLKFHKEIKRPPYNCQAILYENDTQIGFNRWNKSAYSDNRLNLIYNKNLKGNTHYRIFVPKNSIKFADGTTYNKDVDITFIHPKIDLTFIVEQDKDNNKLILRFNKEIKPLSKKSFTIIGPNNTLVEIKNSKRDSNEPCIMIYTLKEPLISGEKYTLTIDSKSINTLSGNTNEKEFVREFIAE